MGDLTGLQIGNASSSTATIHVYVNGVEVTGSPFTIPANASTRKSFANINGGRVQIVSNVPIVVAERVIEAVNGVDVSYSEMMALPNNQLDTTYWLSGYDNVNLDSQLRFANVSDTNATVPVYIGGAEMDGSPFTLLPGVSLRKSFAGIVGGPVKIVSDVPIVAAQRVIYKVNGINTSYSEMMGLPNSQLDTTFWMPWYNNVDLTTALMIGMGENVQVPVTIDYAYDPLNRLTEANYSNNRYYHYTYDAMGNRVSQTTFRSGVTTTTGYGYDDANRLTNVNGVSYDWDANGNLLYDGVNNYQYDSGNRLTVVSGPSVSASYIYNGLGDRIQESGLGQASIFTMDYGAALPQVLSDGTHNYIYGVDRVSQTYNGIPEYFLSDALGSVRQLTDNAGTVIYSCAYDPYGVVTSTSTSMQGEKFPNRRLATPVNILTVTLS